MVNISTCLKINRLTIFHTDREFLSVDSPQAERTRATSLLKDSPTLWLSTKPIRINSTSKIIETLSSKSYQLLTSNSTISCEDYVKYTIKTMLTWKSWRLALFQKQNNSTSRRKRTFCIIQQKRKTSLFWRSCHLQACRLRSISFRNYRTFRRKQWSFSSWSYYWT